MVEVLNRVSMRICPVDETMAIEMIEELQGSRLFDGFRGNPAIDKKKIADVILKTARLMEENPLIREIDFNPVIAGPESAIAVDARIIKHRDKI